MCCSRCDTFKNPHCSMATSAEHRSKFAALHRQWWRLYMSEKFSSRTINPIQTNKQTTYFFFGLTVKLTIVHRKLTFQILLPTTVHRFTYTTDQKVKLWLKSPITMYRNQIISYKKIKYLLWQSLYYKAACYKCLLISKLFFLLQHYS